jgi:hypothetical protein
VPQELLAEPAERSTKQPESSSPDQSSVLSTKTGIHPILQLQRTLGNRRVAQLIQAKRLTPQGRIIRVQPKLTVGAADDEYEEEAERVAKRVVAMPDAEVRPAATGISPVSQRSIQSAGSNKESFEADASVETQLSSTKGSGSPLPDHVRGFMEPRFGADFGQVRVHTGNDAETMNRSVGAQAFAHGSDIYYGAGHSPNQLDLTAHELTHVVQQGGGKPPSAQRNCGECATGGAPCPNCVAEQQEVAQRSPAVVQRHWYNFDIPGTDYQFDPSIEGVKTAAGVVKDTAEAGFDWIVDEIKSLVASGEEWLSDKWKSIQEFASSGLDAAKAALTNILGSVKSPLGVLADGLMNLDAKALAKAWAAFSGLITTVADGFKALTGNLLQQVNNIWDGINSFATSALSRIAGLTENFVFRKLPDALQRVAFTVIDRLKGLWKSINDGWTKLFGKIKSWVDAAIDNVSSFVRRVLSFGINVVIAGIVEFGQIVLFLKDVVSNPKKYVDLLVQRSVKAFDGVESQFAGVIGRYFGNPTAAAAPAVPAGAVEKRRSASWGEIGSGIAEMMGKKWKEFKSNPLSIVTGLLMDMFLPIVGNVKDVVALFTNIKAIVTGPLDAGSLEELWTSLLKTLDIPILIYNTVISILMRSLMVPLIVATFIPHPLVKAIAAAVGEALLAGFVGGEVLNLTQKILLLKTGATTDSEKQAAFNSVADSLVALAMTAVIVIVMLILHFIANVMKGVFNFIKGKVFGIEPKPVAGRGAIPGEGKGGEPGKGGQGEGKGKGPGLGEIEQPSADGERKFRVLDDGECEVCASPCDKLRRKYAAEIAKDPKIEQRINEIESSTDSKSNKARQYREIEQELADARKATRLANEPERLRKFYADELEDPANKKIKDRLDEAEKITDPELKQKALADIQKELSAAKHPTKAGAYHGPKPDYTNPRHHEPGANFRGGGSMTTPLPDDAEAVYRNAVPDAAGRNWYGQNPDGEFYRYQPNGGNDPGVHWNGRENSPRGLVVPPEVRARFR